MKSTLLRTILAGALGTGASAQAILFDQPTDTISVAGNTVIATAFTAEARVMFCPNLPITNSVIFQEQFSGIEDKALIAWAGGVGGTAWNSPQPTHFVVTPLAIPLGTWQHIAFVYDGAEQRVYLQGALIGSRAYTGSVGNSPSSAMSVGAFVEPISGGFRGAFTGLLDTLRISNSVRYTGASFSPPSGNLPGDGSTLLLYHFDEAPGSATVTDLSGNGFHGTLGTGFAGATAPTLGAQRCPTCADEISTIFASNGGGSPGGAVYFDVTTAVPVSITGFTSNSAAPVNASIGLSVHLAPGLGVPHTSGTFALVATDDGLSRAAGIDQPSRIGLSAPFALPAGTYTMALVANGPGGPHAHRYTNGTGSNQNYSDGLISLALGSASNLPFAGILFTPRVWNGSIQYSTFVEPNDECAGAFPIFPGIQGPFTNECATASSPAWACGGAPADVWFAYTHRAPNGMVEIDTCQGASFDTVLEVFHGSCTTLSSIGCSDNACGSRSRVVFLAGQGKTYNFRIGGIAGARGNFLVEIKLQGSTVVVGPGCGAAVLSTASSAPSGLPEIGSTLTLRLAPTLGVAQTIWLGFPPYFLQPPVALCPNCFAACDFELSFTGSTLALPIPPSLLYCGIEFCAQGADVFAPGGCSFGTVSNALRIVIGC